MSSLLEVPYFDGDHWPNKIEEILHDHLNKSDMPFRDIAEVNNNNCDFDLLAVWGETDQKKDAGVGANNRLDGGQETTTSDRGGLQARRKSKQGGGAAGGQRKRGKAASAVCAQTDIVAKIRTKFVFLVFVF